MTGRHSTSAFANRQMITERRAWGRESIVHGFAQRGPNKPRIQREHENHTCVILIRLSARNRCRLHRPRQFLEPTRRETRIRTIDPDIPGAVIGGHLAMDMAVEMPGAFQDPGPGSARVVAEENTLAPVGDFELLRRPLVPFE